MGLKRRKGALRAWRITYRNGGADVVLNADSEATARKVGRLFGKVKDVRRLRGPL